MIEHLQTLKQAPELDRIPVIMMTISDEKQRDPLSARRDI